MLHLPMIGLIKMRNPDKRERDILKTVQLVKETERLVTEESMKKDKFRTKRSRRTSLWALYNWVFMTVWVDWQSTQKGW